MVTLPGARHTAMRDKPSYIYVNRHGEVVEIRGTLTFNGACLGAAH